MDPKIEQRNSQFKIDHLLQMLRLYSHALEASHMVIQALMAQVEALSLADEVERNLYDITKREQAANQANQSTERRGTGTEDRSAINDS